MVEIKLAKSSSLLQFYSISSSISSFMIKTQTGMCCAEWPNILVLLSVRCIHLVWRAQCAGLNQQKKLNLYEPFIFIHLQAILSDCMKFMLLIGTCQYAVSKYFFSLIKRLDNMCSTSISVIPSCQKRFLQVTNTTYLYFNHDIVTVNILILFICYVWHERNWRILVYSNPCLFEVFIECLVCRLKHVQ